MIRFTLPLILIALVFRVCSTKAPENPKDNNPDCNPPVSGLSRETTDNGIEVTFYPAYGYRKGADWIIPMHIWVHENRESTAQPITQLRKRITQLEKIKEKLGGLATTSLCAVVEGNSLKQRLRDFSARDINKRQVEIQFDSDPDGERYQLGTSDGNGLIKKGFQLKLSEAKSQRLLRSQGSTKGWLTYHAVSNDPNGEVLTGKGRIRLIEPEGTSVITDIDDTIKVSDVPAAKKIVLKNTLCCGFVAAPEMACKYRSLWGDLPFHYVSGGPWQLYGPLYDYLISGKGAYPEGTFHLRSIPKNILEEDTRKVLRGAVSDAVFESMFGSLKGTYRHKRDEITKLMDNFPGRHFILIGDSGEMDPEVYRWFEESPKYSKQVKEIWIRDVVNDAKINSDRLKGMNVIPAEKIICATPSHYKKVAAMIDSLHGPAYIKNKLAPCDQPRSAALPSCP